MNVRHKIVHALTLKTVECWALKNSECYVPDDRRLCVAICRANDADNLIGNVAALEGAVAIRQRRHTYDLADGKINQDKCWITVDERQELYDGRKRQFEEDEGLLIATKVVEKPLLNSVPDDKRRL